MGLCKVFGVKKSSDLSMFSQVEAGDGFCVLFSSEPVYTSAVKTWVVGQRYKSIVATGSVRVQFEMCNDFLEDPVASKVRVYRNSVLLGEYASDMIRTCVSLDTDIAPGDELRIDVWCVGYGSRTEVHNFRLCIPAPLVLFQKT